MTIGYLVMPHAIVQIEEVEENWKLVERRIEQVQFECLAFDPHDVKRMYAGTFDHGLWVSDDGGKQWRVAGKGINSFRVSAIAVSPVEVINGRGVVWAGTEPSRLYRSEDGGETWTDCPALLDLPSQSSWSFPPRPDTHHVRWIEADRFNQDKVFVGIELGGVMRSLDKGLTWEDRKPGSQFDCHTMATHPKREERIYEAAGGGFAQSRNGGETWQTENKGLDPFTYLVNIAVAADQPDCILVSGAKGPRQAYQAEQAHSVILKREDNQNWRLIEKGLPEAEGMTVSALANSPTEQGVFYAANNKGVFRSETYGENWEKLPLNWPKAYHDLRMKQLLIR
ncbi:WD40/YVTN/BNR-like repeat-containing protein [Jeotgalibaca ciconiae]|uniref:Exo-alpha-sialidase n=1 Tax=Jeotgalibaca ciconiae TaxID=2496265 RepID=A0A3Q9BLH1_9LACT|nr:sialidase family protein [Jeotgalibaca ciconiae]AZP05113.1 exo-alpha-sialidase [Jeotgalibaca ciconiae]